MTANELFKTEYANKNEIHLFKDLNSKALV